MYITDPQVKEKILVQKIMRWYYLAHVPGLDPEARRQARRNYWKLVRNNARIAKKNGWTEERILEAPGQSVA